MEVKILCPCGAKYKFEVEPQNGRLPGPVSCPVCQADGTELGNQVVAQALGSVYVPTPIPAQAAPVSSSSGGRSGFVAPSVPRSSKEMRAAAAAPVVPVAAPQPTPAAVRVAPAAVVPVGGSSHAVPSEKVVPSGAGPRLSVAGAHAAPAAPMAVTAANSSAPPVPPPPARPQKMEAEPSFMRGVIGIAAASFIALLLWFGITALLGLKLKWLAIGMGAFIGWAGAWMAKERSVKLGVIAATATALTVIFGLMWSARHEAYADVNETIDEMYKEQIEYAKAAVTASRNDTNLLTFIQENGTGVMMSEEGEEEDFDRILALASAQENDVAANRKLLTDFKKNELPKLRKFADGKVSKSQFDREHRPGLESLYTFAYIIGETFRIKILTFIVIAIGAAWKLTSGQ